MSLSFRVNIGEAKATFVNPPTDVDSLQLHFTFANFKSFVKKPLSVIKETKNSMSMTVADWEFNRQFMYETRNAEFLPQKHLLIQLITSSGLIGERKVDLYTLACGPEHHELAIGDDNENIPAVLSFNLTMEQVSEMKLCIRSISVSLNTSLECCLLYQHTGKNAKSHRTNISSNLVSPFWQNLETIFFQCSLKELVQEFLYIQVIRKAHQQLITVASCKIPLYSIISLVNNQTLPFSGSLFYNDVPVGSFNGLIESQNVPTFAQLRGGKNLGYGIVGGAVFYGGVRVPTLPQFPSDVEAQLYYQQNKFKIQQRKQNSVELIQSSFPVVKESSNPDLYTLNSQSPFIKLSNDRLGAKLESSYSGSVPHYVKSSLPIFDLSDRYFETIILDSGAQDFITIGLSPQQYHITALGASDTSYGYISTGKKAHNNEQVLYAPSYTVGDTIGCGITAEGAVYFTKNGEFLGIAYYPVSNKIHNHDLFCTVALHSNSAQVHVNFGQEKFLFNLEHAKLPQGWKLNDTVDCFGRFYFVTPDNNRTFVDPRQNTAGWKEYNEMSERLCNTIIKPLIIHYSEETQPRAPLNQKARWNGIKSPRLINALKVIPRAAFVPEEFYNTANIGQHLVAEINDISFDIPSFLTIVRALDELNLNEGSKFLEIGSGCGFCTAIAGFIVGDKGVACGADLDEHMVEFATLRALDFTKQTGVSLKSVSYLKKNFFQTNSPSDNIPVLPVANTLIQSLISTPTGDEYDAIFCGLEIQRPQLKDFAKLLKRGGTVITGLDGVLKKLKLNDQTMEWHEEVIMKIPRGAMSEVILPTERESKIEKIEAIKQSLIRLGYSFEKIESGLIYLGYTPQAPPDFNFDDPYRQMLLVNYCLLAHHPSLVGFDFSPAEIIDAIETFPSPYQNTTSPEALFYLSHTRSLSSTYQIPTKRVKDVFQYSRGNLELTQRLLADTKICKDRIQQMRKNKPNQPSSNDENELVRNIVQSLIAFNNVDVALHHLANIYA